MPLTQNTSNNLEIAPRELIQAGDTFLLKFSCPGCSEALLEGHPLKECPHCKLNLSNYVIRLPKNRTKKRLLSGSRRKPRVVLKKHVQLLMELCGNKCSYCRISFTGEEYHIDHIIPLAVGGTNNVDNLALACQRCNQKASSLWFSSEVEKQQYLLRT